MDRHECELRRGPEINGAPSPSTRIINEPTTEDTMLMRLTWHHCGRHVCPTFEQWEIGFLVKDDMGTELVFWTVLALHMIQNQVTPEAVASTIGMLCDAECIGDTSKLDAVANHPDYESTFLKEVEKFREP